MAGEEWGENEKDWVEKSEKKMATVFCSYDGVASRLLVFFFPVKGTWLIIKCSP